MVDVARFELTAASLRTKRSSRLIYTPSIQFAGRPALVFTSLILTIQVSKSILTRFANGTFESYSTNSLLDGCKKPSAVACKQIRLRGSIVDPCTMSPTTGQPRNCIAIRIWCRRPVSILISIKDTNSSRSSTRQCVMDSFDPL